MKLLTVQLSPFSCYFIPPWSSNIIRQIKSRGMRRAGHMARVAEGRKVYRGLVEKPEGKRLLERPRRRWEDGIRMDLRKMDWGSMEWIQLLR
jgi:hypothetical protein